MRLSVCDAFGDSDLQVSRVYAMLLGPAGAHGQEPFLNVFLAELDLPEIVRCDFVEVRREHTVTDKKCIDIVVRTPEAVIGIENKPYAKLQ